MAAPEITARPTVLLISQDGEASDDVAQAFSFCLPGAVVQIVAPDFNLKDFIPSFKPDLIILDLDGNRADGFQTLNRVKTLSQIPLITLSYGKDDALVVRALESGADEHISKPVHQMEFIAHARALLRRNTPAARKPG